MDEQHVLWMLESVANYIYWISPQEYEDGVGMMMAVQIYEELLGR